MLCTRDAHGNLLHQHEDTVHAGVGVDAKTGARLKDLEAQKAAAVREEDYDEAKRLKLAIDDLRKLASQLTELEAR